MDQSINNDNNKYMNNNNVFVINTDDALLYHDN